MKQGQSIVFVCEHGSAKSVVAAAHFNRIAAKRGLGLLAVSRGTDPDTEIAPAADAGLRADGLEAVGRSPAEFTQADAAGAAFVVTFCELPRSYATAALVEQWDGVPPVSEDYAMARDEIVIRIERLTDGLGAGTEKERPPAGASGHTSSGA
jgi:arsenate reductase